MSKTTFAKLGLKAKNATQTVEFCGESFEVKQYLPINEKLNLVAYVLNNSLDENNFANPLKIDVFMNLAILYSYTNISFTEKQQEDAPKLFDLAEENGLIDAVIAAMDETEYNSIVDAVDETLKAYYNYKNSAVGIMETITQDYSNIEMDAEELNNKIANPENLALLKDVMNKLG